MGLLYLFSVFLMYSGNVNRDTRSTQVNFLTKFRIGSADSNCAGIPYTLPHHPKRIVMFLSSLADPVTGTEG